METNMDIVNDYLEEFRDKLRLHRPLEAERDRFLRMNPQAAVEIHYAYDKIKAELPYAKSPNSTYDRASGRTRWYVPSDKDRYWPPLKRSIEDELGPDVADSIDESSTAVINGLKPSTAQQHSRGLVLGYVQSGKTTNFMSVIAKAADAGFRLIIVLTGITDNLRQQTQERLDEKLLDTQPERWHKLTSADADFTGDLNGPKLANESERFIAVVKKNSHRLRRLNEWILSAGDAGTSVPILVIDDEADQASINVAKRPGQSKDTAAEKAEIERSAINLQISQLLDHPITGYIAYTATPFANILIDPNDQGDLYPRDFIVTLPEPAGYFGSRALFGRAPLSNEELESAAAELEGFDMIRTIPLEEVDGIRPKKKRKGQEDSDGENNVHGGEELTNAIRWFVLATTARRMRGQTDSPSSMLIHTSMLTDDHGQLESIVKSELKALEEEFHEDSAKWKEQWERETGRVPAELFGLSPIKFEQLASSIDDTLGEVQIIVDNGESKNRLDYGQQKSVIAIGGNTLARGLTLEGLVSSYFVRRASAYDTLLQMGRWFGFRHGYQDLPRIWMPDELRRWFFDLATIEAELREELRAYMEDGQSPVEVQAKIRQHPDMQVTSNAKMQDARAASMSFEGKKEQTIKFFHKDAQWLSENLEAARRLLEAIQARGISEEVGLYGSPTFRKVPNDLVQKFIEDYNFHPDTRLGKDDAELLKRYVEKEASAGRLKYWNVSVITQSRTENVGFTELGLTHGVRNVSRAQLSHQQPDQANIKALVTTLDRLNDVVLEEDKRDSFKRMIEDEVKKTSKERAVRKLHGSHVGAGIGHLALYPIDKDSHPRGWDSLTPEERRDHIRKPLDALDTVLGVGLFFPESSNPDSQVEYVVANEPDAELAEYYRLRDERINFLNDEDEAELEREDDSI